MNVEYVIRYKDELMFFKMERNLKLYIRDAYKKLYFECYPLLRNGNFQGKLVWESKNGNIKKYELVLPTDSMFEKVHGNITLCYTVLLDKRMIMLEALNPEDVLIEMTGETYKGVLLSNSHKELDKFKINCLNSIVSWW